MDNKFLNGIKDGYLSIHEKKKMDDVDKKALKKDFDDRDDKDIDNDGDVDSSDEYLHKRRKAVSKAVDEKSCDSKMKKEEVDVEEEHVEAVQAKNYSMREALKQVWTEANEREKHTKGATKPEGLLDKESPKSKEFIDKHDTEEDDTLVKSFDDVSKAGRVTKQAPARNADQLNVGDKKPVK